MLEAIKHIDLEIFLFLNGLHSSWGDVFFYWVSNTFIWTPLYLFVVFMVIRQWKKKSIAILLVFIVILTCNDQSCNLIKRSVKRLRPSHEVELADQVHLVKKPDGKVYRGGKYSFPSGHAANSSLFVWFFLVSVFPRKRINIILMILWSILLGYSRIYLGVHYPFDVLCGFILGSLWGGVFYLLLNKLLIVNKLPAANS